MPAAVEVIAEPIEQAAADIHIRLHARQGLAFNSPANEILFGGAKGGGKSALIRLGFILLCMMAPGLQCALFRRRYKELQGNHMEGAGSFPDVLAPLTTKGTVSITAHHIRFWNGSHIALNHLQHEKDAYNYSGNQTHAMGFDEATQLEESQYRFLAYTVLRLGGWQPPAHLKDKFPLAWSGANPGGPSHTFFKEGFVDNGPYVIVQQNGKNGGMRRQFIPSRAEDNPTLLKNDPGYLDRLEGAGDKALARALREGDWNVVAGSMFGDAWRAVLMGIPWHVHDGFPIPWEWPLWRGADDGYEDPHACYWMTEDPRYKTLYVVDELYGSHWLPDELAEKILERDKEIELQDLQNPERGVFYNTRPLDGSIDNSAFGDVGLSDIHGRKQLTRGEQMNRKGCRWKAVEKWPGSRVAGVQNFHRLLAPNKLAPAMTDALGNVAVDGQGKPLLEHNRPGIVFFKRCVNAIKHIPALARSERDNEDIADSKFDHSFAGVRYGVQHRRGKFQRVRVGGL